MRRLLQVERKKAVGIKITNFEEKYIDEVINIWNESLKYDPLDRNVFIERILWDPNFNEELFLLSLENDSVVGFLYGICRKVPYGTKGLEPERSYIVAMGVSSSSQQKGVGRELVNHFETKVKDRKLISVGPYSPLYFFPGIDKRYTSAIPFFEKCNYSIGSEAVSMNMLLYDFEIPEIIKELKGKHQNEGIVYKWYNENDYYQVNTFLVNNFPGGWIDNFKTLVNNKTATRRILLAFKNDRVVGYCQRAMDDLDAHFGPFGVSSELQGMGIGKVLFYEMLYNMYCTQNYHVWLAWTSGNSQKFYEKIGMKVHREYFMCKKDLK